MRHLNEAKSIIKNIDKNFKIDEKDLRTFLDDRKSTTSFSLEFKCRYYLSQKKNK